MNQKEYILKLLNALKNDWPMAEGLITLVEENAIDKDSLMALMNIFTEAMKSVSDASQLDKIQKGMAVLEKIKTMEAADHEKEAEELEGMLEGL